MSGKNLKGVPKTFLGINPSISRTSTLLLKFVGDLGYHYGLLSIELFSGALHCVRLLLIVMLVYSFPHHLYSVIHLLSFLQSPEHFHKRVSKSIVSFYSCSLVTIFSMQRRVVFTFLCLFCSFPYIFFSFICFVPTSFTFVLVAHYGLSFIVSFLPFISLGVFFLFTTC